MDGSIVLDGTDRLGHGRPVRLWPLAPMVLVVAAAIAAVGIGTRPDAGVAQGDLAPALDLPDQPRLWTPTATWTELAEMAWSPEAVFRVPGGLLVVHDSGQALIDGRGHVEPLDLPGRVQIEGAVAWGDVVVAHGTPAGTLWIGDGDSWTRSLIPDVTEITAVGRTPVGFVAVGRADDGSAVVAESPDAASWAIHADRTVPSGAVVAADVGLLAYGRGEDGLGYLHTIDGSRWTRVGSHVLRPVGVPAVVGKDDRTDVLRVVGREVSFTPPAWPVTSLWIEGSTIWLTTEGSVWRSDAEDRWIQMPFDGRHGFSGNEPWLVPTPAGPRLLATVEGRTRLLAWTALDED